MLQPPAAPIPVRTSHGTHAIVSLFTCGMWLGVWPLVWAYNTIRNASARSAYQRELRAYYNAQMLINRANNTAKGPNA